MTRRLPFFLSLLLSCQEAPKDASVERDSSRTSIAPETRDSVRSYEQRWIPGQPGEGEYEYSSFFSARSHYFSDGRLLL